MNLVLSKKISLEGKILLLLNFIDIIHTLLSIHLGLAAELNPGMKSLLEYSIPAFVVGKIAVVSALVFALEILRGAGANASWVRFWQWIAIIAYPAAFLLANLLFPYLRILWRLT